MPTKADVKAFALSHDSVTEVDHFGRPSYRTKKRIFAVMRPDGLFLHFPDEQRKEFLFEADPKVFVKFMWGPRSNVIVQIDKISKRELEALIKEAWAASYMPPRAKKAAKARK